MARFLFCLSLCRILLAFPPCGVPASDPQHNLAPARLMELGHFRQAEALLEPLAQREPENGETAALLSRAKAALGDLETALQLAEKAVSLDESRASYHVQLAAVTGRMAEKASLLKQLGFAKRAKKELDTAVALDPQNIDALYGLMLYYYAAPSFMGGDKNKSQQMADAMTAIDPARGFLAQARLAKDRKDAQREEEFYRKSIEANPKFYEANVTLASFYLEKSDPDFPAAAAYACDALAIDPGGAQAWKILASIEVADQCWTELDSIVAAALERNPLDLGPYYSAAVALLRANRLLPTAETYLRQYLLKPPDANEPSPGLAHWQLGLILEKLDRKAEAAAELKLAIELEPTLEGAKKDLRRLK